MKAIATLNGGKKALDDPKREIFAREYSRHGEGQRAVVAAGYNCKTWENDGSTSAASKACQLLNDVKVQYRIQWLKENRARKADITEVRLLRELERVAFFDIRKIFEESGDLKNVATLPPEVAAGIQAVDIEKLFGTDDTGRKAHVGYTVKIKTHDKLAAIEKLMKYLNMVNAPAEGSATVNNIENQQVNFYLPENARHAKSIPVQPSETADSGPKQLEHLNGVALPPKDRSGSH